VGSTTLPLDGPGSALWARADDTLEAMTTIDTDRKRNPRTSVSPTPKRLVASGRP
jgi:hypothetical protein